MCILYAGCANPDPPTPALLNIGFRFWREFLDSGRPQKFAQSLNNLQIFIFLSGIVSFMKSSGCWYGSVLIIISRLKRFGFSKGKVENSDFWCINKHISELCISCLPERACRAVSIPISYNKGKNKRVTQLLCSICHRATSAFHRRLLDIFATTCWSIVFDSEPADACGFCVFLLLLCLALKKTNHKSKIKQTHNLQWH